jgi:signal transduction histidine kinase
MLDLAAAASDVRNEIERLRREIERLRVIGPDERGLLEAVLHHSPHGMMVCDAAGKLLVQNRAAERIWAGSATATSIDGWAAYRTFHADGRPHAPEDWSLMRCLRNGVILEGEEIRFQRFDGSFGTMLSSCAPIDGPEGQRQGALTVFADISPMSALFELSEACARAETTERIFSAALDAITKALAVERASILLFDADGVMRFKAWRGLSDAYRAAVEGHSPWAADAKDPQPVIVPDYRLDAHLAGWSSVFDREGIRALGFFPLCSEGRLLGKFMVYHREPHSFPEREERIASLIARKIAVGVELQATHDERERFVGIVGHDLRNPLGAIHMGASSLLRRDLDEGSTRIARRIVASAERMDRLIQQLLAFAQARHGEGLPIHRAVHDLGDIAAHVVEELEAAYPERSIELSTEGPVAGDWDGDRLAEVLSNLIGNAVQHGAEAPVRVRVRGGEDGVVIEVHNDGPPIPPELMPRLFDPFRRGTTDVASRSRSVGLGLYISRELVRAHGGNIEVVSQRDTGTRFTVRLPHRARVVGAVKEEP